MNSTFQSQYVTMRLSKVQPFLKKVVNHNLLDNQEIADIQVCRSFNFKLCGKSKLDIEIDNLSNYIFEKPREKKRKEGGTRMGDRGKSLLQKEQKPGDAEGTPKSNLV